MLFPHQFSRKKVWKISLGVGEKVGIGKLPIFSTTMKLDISFFTAIATLAIFFLVIMSPSSASPSATGSNNEPSSAYDLLREFNFPIGLLPEGSVGYDVDRSTGKFKANFNGSCNFKPDESYELKYKSTISGKISRNKLRDLKGVSVKIMFFWLDIVEVVRDGDDLQFSVGIASASFPVENFTDCPKCGCGVKCKNEKVSKLDTKFLVSST